MEGGNYTVRGGLSVEVVCLNVGGNLCLPLVAVVEQLFLVVEQLLVGLSAECEKVKNLMRHIANQ